MAQTSLVCPRFPAGVCIVAAFALAVTTGAQAAGPAVVEVQADEVVGPVNKRVFGNNVLAYQYYRRHGDKYCNRGAGIWDPDKMQPVPEYVQLARLAGITVARWPGGCQTHRYNWKKVVGPVPERPMQKFGLSEFLVWCRAVGAEPLITIAGYWGNHRDAADLVEYLNARPGENPNGGKDWAAVRAAEGYREPWNVVWFEYGNETYHGDHTGRRKMTPEQYARRYLLYRRAMKAIDPRVKLGAVVQADDRWGRTVVRMCGKAMDFLITHTYIPGAWRDEIKNWSPRQVAEACVAADYQIRQLYAQLRRMVVEECGRDDLPIAVTEYNGGFVQEKPVPYRQSLAVALRNADHIRVMLDPAERILMANFWQYSNEYWGMVQGYVHKGQKPVKQANFFVYQLYHEHFGGELLKSAVECGRWDFDGACRLKARRGNGRPYTLVGENLYHGEPWQITRIPQADQKLEDGGRVLEVTFKGSPLNYYHASIRLPAEPRTGYRVVGWIKTQELRAQQGAGFQIGDARGWTATHSATVVGDVRGTSNGWVRVVGEYTTLPDTEAIQIVARRLGRGDRVSGRAWYRVESVQKFLPEVYPAVPYVKAIASRRRADGKICLMLINTDLDAATPVTIRLRGARARAAKAWALVGPSPDATNLRPPYPIGLREVACDVVNGNVRLALPKYSVVAVEVTPGR